jgi:excisionase family DNA binding protein
MKPQEEKVRQLLIAISDFIDIKAQARRSEAEAYKTLSGVIKNYLREEKNMAAKAGRPPKAPALVSVPTLENKEYLSVSDVMKRTGIGRTKLYNEMNEGRLQANKCGRQTLISQENFRKWVEGFSRY